MAKKRLLPAVLAIGAGVANGLLGSGGGMLVVPALEKHGLEKKHAHATSIAVIAPISLLSAALSLVSDRVTIGDALPYLPGGVIGAALGCMLMRRLSPRLLGRIFGAFAIWAGIRLLTG